MMSSKAAGRPKGIQGMDMTPNQSVCFLVMDMNRIRKDGPGIAAKIDAQVSAFRKGGVGCEIISCDCKPGAIWKIVKRLPFGADGMKWDEVELGQCGCLYIRKEDYVSRQFLAWLKKEKREHPGLKVLLEIPTYPYDGEYRGRRIPLLLKDRFNRGKLIRYVDRIVDLSGEKEIFGIKTVHIFNGIDFDSVSPRNPSGVVAGGRVEIACVATFGEWHGADRILAGLRGYYCSGGVRDVVLHLVGDGPALPNLQRLAQKFGLGDHVVFHGRCDREQMDEVYDRCSLAIASLGLHRLGLSVASTLKSREYLAKGIPFAYSGEIDVFLKNPVDFCLQIPADESPVDVRQLIDFHDALYAGESEDALISRIRSYAECNVGIEVGMKNVIDYVKENC